jgi:hypothetical protein
MKPTAAPHAAATPRRSEPIEARGVARAEVWKALGRGNASNLVRLLTSLKVYLKSAIECAVAAGETQPREEWLRPEIARCRRELREVEQLIEELVPACEWGPEHTKSKAAKGAKS